MKSSHRGHVADRHRLRRAHWATHRIGHRVRVLPSGYRRFYVPGRHRYYYYYDGSYYDRSGDYYTVVDPPLAAEITGLPTEYIEVVVGSTTYYYAGGAFYVRSGSRYVVVEAPEGAVVPYLTEGYQEVFVSGTKYYKYAGVHYEPVQQGGEIAYRVVKL